MVIPDRRLDIAIVGLGFGAQIIKGLSANPYVRVAAVCDRDFDKAEPCGRSLGVPVYDDLARLLENPDIPAIGLFTGPVGRADLIRQCIRAGKDVITTKPIERNADAALDVLREAKRLGRVVHLNSPGPVLPPEAVAIQDWQRRYDLGAPVACRRGAWASYREEPDGTWYDDLEACPAAPIFRLGIYLINDLILFLGEPDRVTVLQSRLRTGRPTADNAQLGILFKNGAIANVFASFCIDDGAPYQDSIVLNFEHGTVHSSRDPERPASPTLSLSMNVDGKQRIVETAPIGIRSGQYRWDLFTDAVRGVPLENELTPEQIVAGVRVIEAMVRAQNEGGVATV